MNCNVFREYCAEKGIELTPDESQHILNKFESLKKVIKQAYNLNPDFYKCLCDKGSQFRHKISEYEGHEINKEDYEELLNIIKLICQMEGYV